LDTKPSLVLVLDDEEEEEEDKEEVKRSNAYLWCKISASTSSHPRLL
jgi:hypothetical protein